MGHRQYVWNTEILFYASVLNIKASFDKNSHEYAIFFHVYFLS